MLCKCQWSERKKVKELIDEQRQDNVWNVWENLLRIQQADDWRFALRCKRGRRRQWHPTPVLLPGKSHGWRSLVGCSPWGGKELDVTERLHFHFSLSCIGEGNGNPLQCSCLEYPRDGGAWWAAVYGVAQSQTRLKWLSSSSSSKRGKSGWETMKTEGEISENCRLHCEWFLTWKHQWCLKIVLKVSANC